LVGRLAATTWRPLPRTPLIRVYEV
jgi:hypothetical protein